MRIEKPPQETEPTRKQENAPSDHSFGAGEETTDAVVHPALAETQDIQAAGTVSEKKEAPAIESEDVRWGRIEKQHLAFFDQLHQDNPGLLDRYLELWFKITEARKHMLQAETASMDNELTRLLREQAALVVGEIPPDINLFVVKWVSQQPDVSRYRDMWHQAEAEMKEKQRRLRPTGRAAA